MNNHIGVRFVECPDKRIFFIHLRCFNEYNDKAYMENVFFTTDCIVAKIEDADTGELCDEVTACGIMHKSLTYKKGQRISDDKTYYCRTVSDLLYYGFCDRDKSGHYYVDIWTKARRRAVLVEDIRTFLNKLKQK